LAGQICGTTGYEEAAAQGIIAGANAGLMSQAKPQLTIGRDEGYIGVLIDDLVTKGVGEPYRMFTSRAEYRLSLRQDNADIRLTQKGFDYGVVGAPRLEVFLERKRNVDASISMLESTKLSRNFWSGLGSKFHMSQGDGLPKSAAEMLSRPDVDLSDIEKAVWGHANEDALRLIDIAGEKKSGNAHASEVCVVPIDSRDTVEAHCKYSNYLKRQEAEMQKWRRNTAFPFPDDVVYCRAEFPGCSTEELELLAKHRPKNLQHAQSIQGITPHTLVYLQNYFIKGRHLKKSSNS
jgi:tRNA uridine 5-carboxymethylaminomethyl modification enzyme